ncbi:S-adenosylmethionine synthetase N-terminal domain-containing protein [Streptomyces sp. NPDC007002]|uniref:S-adenosylmethionine synthetase N-terminal domain-containing protein n=1 Tax=Streptomyces sp. NPDC007002 TaxID=3156910 RepID=UPI00345246B4
MRSPTPRGPSSIGVAAEGHPDKVADRVSGAVSGRTARPGPGARVAMETLITTGRVHVAGEGTVCAGIPALIRDAVLDIGHRQQIRTPGHGRGVRAAHSGHRHPRRYGPPWRRRPLGHEGPVSARFARAGRRTVGAALAGRGRKRPRRSKPRAGTPLENAWNSIFDEGRPPRPGGSGTAPPVSV